MGRDVPGFSGSTSRTFLPLVDHVAIEDVDRGVAACDDFDGIPAIHFEFARQVLLVGDAPPSQHARLAPLLRVLIRRHSRSARLGVDPGVDRQAMKGDQVAHVGLLDLELERARPDRVGPENVVVQPASRLSLYRGSNFLVPQRYWSRRW